MDQSAISLNASTFEDRYKNVQYLRALYGFFALQLILVLAWCGYVLYNDKLGDWIVKWWGIALFTGIVAVILILVAAFWRGSRDSPINFIIYGLFTLCFGWTMGYLCRVDWVSGSQLVFYCLCVLTAIAICFFVYAWCTSTYMQALSAILFILAAAFAVFFLFLVFSDIAFYKLLITMVPVIIFGYYLNYDIRKMVRGSLYDTYKEDPVSGAVRIWIETAFVFCRLAELIGGMFFKGQH